MSSWLISKKEEDEKVLKNQPLVRHIIKQMKVAPSDYDDVVQEGTIGLIKAARTFNNTKSKFATYATRCIQNEIFMYFRQGKKHANDISLDDPVHTDNNGNELTLGDTIPITTNFTTSEIEDRETIHKVFSIILNLLNHNQKLVILYRLAGKNQTYIGKMLNLSQSYISRIEKKLGNIIKTYLNTTKQFKEVFSMVITDELYELSFSTSDVGNFNKIFSSLLKKFTSTESLPSFKVIHFDERVVIQTPADTSSFYLIAKLIESIENFSLTYASSENTLFANDENFQTEGCANTYHSDDIVIEHSLNNNVQPTVSESTSTISIPGKEEVK